MVQALDSAGRPVRLGREIGRGGEGTVYELEGRADRVAKLYFKQPDANHAAKLAAMAGAAEEPLLRVAAWPTETLRSPTGAVIGFVMPRIAGHKPVFQLYSPKLRLQTFPKADWAFLIHAAANVARAVAVVHAAGHVIGDINHGNLMVAEDATVRLIDCDSFQVRRGCHTWFCRVGVGTHQPPEMQGLASYDGIVRTPNHDMFGLAVIIFQLLCTARHPFAGRFLGTGPPPSIEEAITQGRYAYARDQTKTLMAPPPASLPMEALTPRLRDLFETAFSLSSKSGGRPTPADWVQALEDLARDLKPCVVNRAHVHRRGLAQCPWCAIETASGVPLFPGIFVGATSTGGGMLVLWPQVLAVASPKPLPPPPASPGGCVPPSPAVRVAQRRAKSLRTGAYVSLGCGLAAILALSPPSYAVLLIVVFLLIAGALSLAGDTDDAAAYRSKLAEVERAWTALIEAWKPHPGVAEFAALRLRLDKLKSEHDGLGTERARRLQRLSEGARERQLEAYLTQFAIADARISGIGRAKVATLSAYGIDTAADIDPGRIAAIPGFGPVTIRKLMGWRKHHEKGFVFDPTLGPDAASLQIVEREIAQKRSRIEAEVAAGLARLRTLAAAAEMHREKLERTRADLAPRLAQARADALGMPTDQSASRCRIALGIMTTVIMLAIGLPALPPKMNRPSAPPPAVPTAPWMPSAPPTAALAPHPAPPPVPSAVPSATALVPPPTIEPEVAALPPSTAQVLATPEAQASGPQPRAAERMITRQASNVREGPAGTAPVVRVVPQGAILTVFDRRSGWVQVGDRTPWGWIHSSLLDPQTP
jgi:DNA-binding helix-hairpin-helix protein with protein kinase domain